VALRQGQGDFVKTRRMPRRRMDHRPEPIDMDNLGTYWQRVAEFDEQAHQAIQSWHTMNFTARFIDESQPAGPRTHVGVDRLLAIAMDNQEAFQSLITTRGVTHWSQWNLLRPVFEASFYVIWILDQRESKERRKRGLRPEVLDSKEQTKWIDALRDAGLDSEALEAFKDRRTEAERVYRDEANLLGLTWALAGQPVNVVQQLLALNYTKELFSGDTYKFLVSIWRRLSGFQHGFGCALMAGADKRPVFRHPRWRIGAHHDQ
jgi:hypothetical protein